MDPVALVSFGWVAKGTDRCHDVPLREVRFTGDGSAEWLDRSGPASLSVETQWMVWLEGIQSVLRLIVCTDRPALKTPA